MAKGAGDTEDQQRAAPGTPADAMKTKRSGTNDGATPGADLCDDIVGNILSRLPARAAVASMTLSKNNRRLIRSVEFRSLHCRLAPPLPRLHIAYLATSLILKRRAEQVEPVSGFIGFHVAGGGVSGGGGTTPMRSLAGQRYLDLKYVNTCNGIVLLASDSYSAPCRCVFWNPAVADVVEEVSVSDPNKPAMEYLVLGLGYGQRSKTYKIILMCREKGGSNGGTRYSFAIFPLGGDENKPTELPLPSAQRDVEGSLKDALYIDGKIYHLVKKNLVILAFDVDEERVTSIDVPVELPVDRRYLFASKIMEMSGRPCLVVDQGGDCTLWVLSGDHQWDRKHVIYLSSIKGVWDCGGVLVFYLHDNIDEDYDILLYNVTMEKMFKAKIQQDMAPPSYFSEFSNYALCWGYRPTLVSPSSIIRKFNTDTEQSQECSRYIMKALKPFVDKDRRTGREATLSTVCFMDFLVRIMQKLPKELQQVLEMKLIDSNDLDFFFQNVPFA